MREKITPECVLYLSLHKRVDDATYKCSKVLKEAHVR